MARKSRKETAGLPAPEIDTTCRAGVYVRLSVEDKHTRTASIETQQLIIARYLEQKSERFDLFPSVHTAYSSNFLALHSKIPASL